MRKTIFSKRVRSTAWLSGLRNPALRRRAFVGALLSLHLAGCGNLAGPEYVRPTSPKKAAWVPQAQTQVSATETIRPDWWSEFGDPYLDGLVQQAIADNIDIKVLAARIQVAKAGIDVVGASAKPTVGAGAGIDVSKVTGRSRTTKYSVGTSANWEIDIWGRVEKGVQAQEAEFRATEADWRAGYLRLVSDVANTYFAIRTIDEQIKRQRHSLDTNQQILNTYTSLHREGVVPKTRVLQQESEVFRLETELLELRRRRQLAENGLATLVGVPAGGLEVPLGELQTRVSAISVPLGLPSQLLERRPDIVASEYRVLSAHDLAGQARLARLPSVSLTGQAGTASNALSNLLKTFTFGLSPAISIPIFDPTIKPRIKVSEAEAKLATEQYRGVVIRAFEEVENSLTSLAARKRQREQVQEQVEALRIVAQQVQRQLNEGLVSQLEVFEAERSLLRTEQALLVNYQQILADTVALYKALGGGWPVEQVGKMIK